MAIIESNDNKEGFSKFFFKFTDKDKNNGVDRQELKQLLTFFLDIYKKDAKSEEQNKQEKSDENVSKSEIPKGELEQLRDDLISLRIEMAKLRQELNELKSKVNNSKDNDEFENALAKIDELVNEAFEKYDKGKKGFLNEEEFSEFFSKIEDTL